MALLSSLFYGYGDHINDSTPTELIKKLLPDVSVKGADYAVENIVGATEVIANGGDVKT